MNRAVSRRRHAQYAIEVFNYHGRLSVLRHQDSNAQAGFCLKVDSKAPNESITPTLEGFGCVFEEPVETLERVGVSKRAIPCPSHHI
jgi:hypothetical protein